MKTLILKDKFTHTYDPDKIYESEFVYLIEIGRKSEWKPKEGENPITRRFCENSDSDISKYIKITQSETIKSVQIKLLKELGKRNNY